MKGFNIAPPGSTGSLAPVAEFSTSLDNFEQQHEILTSTLSTLFTPTFMHKKPSYCASDSCNSMELPSALPPATLMPPMNTVQTINKYNKSALKPYNKRIAGHKKKWGTLIEAAKVGNVTKMLGRSKSEDSVCNSSQNSSPVHGQVRVTYSQNCGQNYYNSGSGAEANLSNSSYNKDYLSTKQTGSHLSHALHGIGGGGGTHFFHATTG